ncbi:DNA-3-methyladenine glycosylase I [Acidihalobacter prosperus]
MRADSITHPTRCAWALKGSRREIIYHDTEWGVPSFDENYLFEMLILETAQAGLSWRTILDKREGYRQVFEGFDPMRMASFDGRQRTALLNDSRIIRNKRKIDAAISNAQALLAFREKGLDFGNYLWGFVDGQPIQNHRRHSDEIPASTPLSETMSRDLKQRGFCFLGPTTCYAFMQAVGMVNDHLVSCFRHSEL